MHDCDSKIYSSRFVKIGGGGREGVFSELLKYSDMQAGILGEGRTSFMISLTEAPDSTKCTGFDPMPDSDLML